MDTKRTKGMVPLPEHWFFGRQVAAAGRDYLQRYLLPGRRFLGPTSMDAEMAFIMCNHALASGGRPCLLALQSNMPCAGLLQPMAHLAKADVAVHDVQVAWMAGV